MQYQEYLEKCKIFAKKSTKWQRFLALLFGVIVLVVAIFLINPRKRLLEMRNSQRRSDVVNILNAVYQYGSENGGEFSSGIGASPTMICRSGAQSCSGLVDISQILKVEKKLLSSVPVDPTEKDPNISGYQISRLSNGRMNVTAPLAENNAVISLSK